MLRALELIGFKSFADKTRFEFPRGITTVVGPNGSGKSNVVDAIKWVLGEQSVKSLRGKEMTDVIFNGAAGRAAQNTAEATLTFDNSERLLAIDTPEVHVTRRVYRSGEGEYLINRQPARLRDIRDLFRGTGVATDAYSVIEQGKVDVMLQSSPKERRAIFEEAAGISRFKAKKVESLRRLERVEQNLLRLSDIVNEVESRLRSVRMQASKARRYKEHADRLQELRTQVGWADWRSLTERLTKFETEIEQLSAEREAASAGLAEREAETQSLDEQLAAFGDDVRQREARQADVLRQIAGCESSAAHQRQRLTELAADVDRHRGQLVAMNLRVGDLRQQLQETVAGLAEAEVESTRLKSDAAHTNEALVADLARLKSLRAEDQALRAEHVANLRETSALGNEAGALEAQIELARGTIDRCDERLREAERRRAQADAQLAAAQASLLEFAAEIESRATDVAEAERQLANFRRERTARSDELNHLRQRHAGASERRRVIEELEARFEGLQTGVKEVILAARSGEEGPFRSVLGMVADLLRAGVETASMIDAALGERSQYLVIGGDDELLDFLELQTYRLKGRVHFLRRDWQEAELSAVELDGEPGVIGRADRFVETLPELSPLVRRLLGDTWLVEKLSDARALAAKHGRQVNYVTRAGETLSADGGVSVGLRQEATGLISRRSELRALKQMLAELDSAVAAASAATLQLDDQIAAAGRVHDAAQQRRQADLQGLAERRTSVSQLEAKCAQAAEQVALIGAEATAAEAKLTECQARRASVFDRRDQLVARAAELEASLAERTTTIERVAAENRAREEAATQGQIELAKCEQRLENFRARQAQFERDQHERERALAEHRAALGKAVERHRVCELAILSIESQAAELFLAKEAAAADVQAAIEARRHLQERRSTLGAEAQRLRVQVHALDQRLHARQLSASEVRHERATLADRLREDYGIDLAELEHEPTAEELRQREQVEEEIAELRRKLNAIGNVNLDALEELDSLEERFATLSAQFEDLTKAKALLEQIIHKINADSRRLFTETLEIVKTNFQALFRKLFGGGQADVILEEGVDVLESGIEIIARPPGKEPRNISLLSGGEKTMTCVALLLSIFQFRPSPFCVLDEVDAALDEANIQRFINVLQEFLAWTQFIVITHSKKTMTCAHTLYGVTMQESGISKRVAVRFEDVSDDGHIREGAGDDASEAA